MAKITHAAQAAPTEEKLRATIQNLDCLSQEGFTEISAIAKLILTGMEAGASGNDMETIAYAIRVIWSKADDTQNAINCDAEAVGCNYVDDAASRRYAARQAERQRLSIGGAEGGHHA